MNQTLVEFIRTLEQRDKAKCVEFSLGKLSRGELDIPRLYLEVLAPALNCVVCASRDSETSVWREHVKSAIVRIIIECSHPYVIKERNGSKAAR